MQSKSSQLCYDCTMMTTALPVSSGTGLDGLTGVENGEWDYPSLILTEMPRLANTDEGHFLLSTTL